MAEEGTIEQMREFAIHRSMYQLKEADAHTWGIPRYAGPSRSAMIEIQMDEYGNGRPGEAHAELFADTIGRSASTWLRRPRTGRRRRSPP